MFVWQGFLTRCLPNVDWTEQDAERYGGQIGAAILVAGAVELLAQELEAFWRQCPKVSFPGVFDYEVSEALGGWLRLHALGSGQADVRLKARELIESFFLHGQGQ